MLFQKAMSLILRDKRPVLYRREKPVKWTVSDAAQFRSFLESESGRKLLAFQDDAMINALLRGGITRNVLSGWKYGLEYLLTYKGEKQADVEAPGTLVPIQFTDSDEEEVK